MPLKIKLSQKLGQKMALTPRMKQSIHILQLPILELKGYLEQQIEENPTLEAGLTAPSEETPLDEKISKLLTQEEDSANVDDYFNPGYNQDEMRKKQDYRESLITKELTLQEHLLRQLHMNLLTETEDKIGEYLISCIDKNGYFQNVLEEVLRLLATKEGVEITIEEISRMLSVIQGFEPIGVGGRDLKECLMIQLQTQGKQDSLAARIVANYLPELGKHKLKAIAKSLKTTLNNVTQAVDEISHLEPKPGRSFTQTISRRIIPREADIILDKVDDEYQLIINDRCLPRLRISRHYKKILGRKDIPSEARNYVKEKIGSALWIIKAITQRRDTIRRITETIMEIQKDFFEYGSEEYLKPLTLQDIAQRVDRNESTVSRVVNNKYIQTPFGIFKLSHFFSSAFKTTQGSLISSEAIRSRIMDLIDDEDTASPLSDDKIVTLLKAQGINIARRTIAKYREELKIPPSHQRKK